jgi:hypothetical protein
MKRILREIRIGDSSVKEGSKVRFGKNEEYWTGIVSGNASELSNGKMFYWIENAVSDSGKIRSFDIERDEIQEILPRKEV